MAYDNNLLEILEMCKGFLPAYISGHDVRSLVLGLTRVGLYGMVARELPLLRLKDCLDSNYKEELSTTNSS